MGEQLQPFFAGRFERVQRHVVDDLLEHQRFLGDRIARLGFGERQHSGHHPREPAALFRDRVERRAKHFGIAIAPALEHLRVPVDDRQRGAQFVGGVADELALARERRLQAIEHRIERVRESADLVAAFPPQPAVEAFRADFGHLRGQPFDRIGRRSGNEVRGGRDHDHRGQRDQQQDQPRARDQLVDDVEPLTDVRDQQRPAVDVGQDRVEDQHRPRAIAGQREHRKS